MKLLCNGALQIVANITIYILWLTCSLLFLPFAFIVNYIYRRLIMLIACLRPGFGNILTPRDHMWADEDFTQYPPKNSLICTITLEGDMSAIEFRDLFQHNVLDAIFTPEASLFSWKAPKSRTRYPELKQHQVNFMGFKFWKEDSNFKIENHIVEQIYYDCSLASIHQQSLNKPFNCNQSPWDVTLLRNFTETNTSHTFLDHEQDGKKTLVLVRFHHSMSDAKSILKMFVECLGQQQLTLAKAQDDSQNLLQKVLFYLLFPVNFIILSFGIARNVAGSIFHPWRLSVFETVETMHVVGISGELSLSDIKWVAKKNGVTGSSVIMALITGAMSKMEAKFKEKAAYSSYTLPKPNHPPTLVNHSSIGALMLPTNEPSSAIRLRKCHTAFCDIKATDIGKYFEFPSFQAASFFSLVRKWLARNILFPMIITNIAGEAKGFSIGKHKCSELIFSVGTLSGCSGVIICASSYRNQLRIAVIAEDKIMNEIQVQKLANEIEKELEELKEL